MSAQPSITFKAERFLNNPIIHPNLPGLEGQRGHNINGPSLIRVPEWIANPLGRYYLYFAHHQGAYIRLAYANTLQGPWTIHEPGVLHMDQGPGSRHIASPDVHVDLQTQQIRMYFHQPAPTHLKDQGQLSYAALSPDGLHFQVRDEVLGKFYFRVCQHGGWFYAFAKNDTVDGIIYRSADGLTNFQAGPHFLPRVRHTALWLNGDTLYLFYTLTGDAPERILLSTIDLNADWQSWQPSPAQTILKPSFPWEGCDQPLEPSRPGASHHPVHQLRDPAIYAEDDQLYLLYSVAGEQGIAIARLLCEKNGLHTP
jgi:hypothetical protein